MTEMQGFQTHSLVAEESCGMSVRRKYWRKNKSTPDGIFIEQSGHTQSLQHYFMSVFLPQGYPHSVSKDYLSYQLWDSIQAFASGITSSLSTQAILKAVGVGDSTATPLAATLTWLLKDGTSMIGRILFAWLKGSSLDCDCKKWRLFADILNDSAIFVDLISPYFPNYITLVSCISGLGKSIVGVAGGATRAALTQHQARKNNMADVAAKDGSQETLVNLSALICSLILIPVISENHMLKWVLFFFLTSVHLLANYAAVSSVVMEIFNKDRFKIVMNDYLETGIEPTTADSVGDANRKECVFLSPWPEEVSIKLGISLEYIFKRYEAFELLKYIYSGSNYILNIGNNSKNNISINIVLHDDSTPETKLEAMFHACVLHHVLRSKSYSAYSINPFYLQLYNIQETAQKGVLENTEKLLKLSRKFTSDYFPSFLKKIQLAGWVTDCTLFGEDEWRAKW